jgi:hypothetical protein
MVGLLGCPNFILACEAVHPRPRLCDGVRREQIPCVRTLVRGRMARGCPG